MAALQHEFQREPIAVDVARRIQDINHPHNQYTSVLIWDPYRSLLISGGNEYWIRLWSDSNQSCGQLGTTQHVCSLLALKAELVSGHKEGEVNVWAMSQAGRPRVLTLKSHKSAVRGLAVLPSGELVIGAEDIRVFLRSSVSGYELGWTLQEGALCLCAIDGRILPQRSGALVVAGASNGCVNVWSSGVSVAICKGHRKPVTTLCFVEDGNWCVSGSADFTLRVWDIVSWRCERELKGHAGIVFGLSWSTGLLLSCSQDGSVRIWDTCTWSCERVMSDFGSEVYCVCALDDGRFAVGGAGPKITFYGNSEHMLQSRAANVTPSGALMSGKSLLDNNFVGEVAEIVLECVQADGVDVGTILPAHRSIVIQADGNTGRLHGVIGRQHQPNFFERLVPKKELLSCVSRSHFEIVRENHAASPTVRKLSKNALLLNATHWISDEPTPIRDGSHLGFSSTLGAHQEPLFLVLRLAFRSKLVVEHEGSHPALELSQPGQVPRSMPLLGQGPPVQIVAGVLECVFAIGADRSMLPQEARVIGLPINVDLEIGRLHQPGTFETLLKADAQWLSFVSRTHCRVKLTRTQLQGISEEQALESEPNQTNSRIQLSVENLSANAVVASGKTLGKGKSVTIFEGATLAFVAAPSDGSTVKFLEFRLRRAQDNRR